jgi:hypothetical protein
LFVASGDNDPNEALAYHNAQLQAVAFSEEFDAESFEDLTEPKVDMIHKVPLLSIFVSTKQLTDFAILPWYFSVWGHSCGHGKRIF